MKRTAFIILCLLFYICQLSTQTLSAQTSFEATKDSLLRIYVTSQPDSNRLVVIHNLAKLHQQRGLTFIYYEDLLLKEATKQQNLKYQSKAIYEHIIHYYNEFDIDNVLGWMGRMEDFANKHSYYEDYFNAKRLEIETYNIYQQIERAIIEAEAMSELARKQNNRAGMRGAALCLATSYSSTMRYDECKEQLKLAYSLFRDSDPPLDQVNQLTKIITIYAHLQMLEEQKTALDALVKAIDRLLVEAPVMKNAIVFLNLFIESQYAMYYLNTGNLPEALAHLQKAEPYVAITRYIPYQSLFYQIYAAYYQETNNYEQALAYINKATAIVGLNSASDVVGCRGRKADILVKMGHPDEALPIYEQTLIEKDSIYRDVAILQMEQIRSLYEIDKLTLQKEQQSANFKYFSLSVIFISTLSLIFFAIHLYRSRKKMLKNEKEAQQLTQIAENANEVKGLFLANMSYNIRIPLNNVVGFSQLLSTEEELTEEERKEYSAIIQSNSGELIQLVNDVLDLSRLEAKMMKFQLQDISIESWYTELCFMVKMRSEGRIQLISKTAIENAQVHTDSARLTQMLSTMLLYPIPCDTPREITIKLTYHPEFHELRGRIGNSPMADPAFSSQKIIIRQRICQLFFEHFGGNFQIEECAKGEIPVITFMFPTLS
ncbi:MAG: histidine kinase dimerization/phospho-acceptor domain-containing protein [Bacteroides sp.]|nr:histidine kinase dimerization/phospho-acceptor domain-containing protein [Bacteroides sp.]